MSSEMDKSKKSEEQESNPLSSVVSVYGPGIGKPLVCTKDVRLIQIRDEKGELTALFFRLTPVLWAFSTKGDSDFESHRRRLEVDDLPFLEK